MWSQKATEDKGALKRFYVHSETNIHKPENNRANADKDIPFDPARLQLKQMVGNLKVEIASQSKAIDAIRTTIMEAVASKKTCLIITVDDNTTRWVNEAIDPAEAIHLPSQAMRSQEADEGGLARSNYGRLEQTPQGARPVFPMFTRQPHDAKGECIH